MDDIHNNKKDVKKMNQPSKKPGNKKAFLWVVVAVGIFMLLLLLSGGVSFWFWLGLALWIGYILFVKIKYVGGDYAFSKVLGMGIGVFFLSFIFLAFTPSEQNGTPSNNVNSFSNEEESEDDFQEIELAIEPTKVEIFLMKLKNDTNLQFSEIEDASLLWKGSNVNMILQEVESFQLKDAGEEDVKKINTFFTDLGWDHGTVGFTYTPIEDDKETGYASTSMEPAFKGIMCVIDQNDPKAVVIKCGLSPEENE